MRWSGELIGGVLRRPDLWAEALRALVALAPDGWWRRPPFVPVPEPDYAAWRIATAYGDPDADVRPSDVIAYLAWRRRRRRGSP
jgi:hypothetical protein